MTGVGVGQAFEAPRFALVRGCARPRRAHSGCTTPPSESETADDRRAVLGEDGGEVAADVAEALDHDPRGPRTASPALAKASRMQ